MSWLDRAPAFDALEPQARARLEQLAPQTLPPGAVLFHPGESVKGYAIVLSGAVDVSLTGHSGREMLLYSVAPGQSCIQSTLGLLGGGDYTAEGITRTQTELVLLPREVFLALIDSSRAFRTMVFHAFASRMQNMMQLVEKVAFQRVECRLAQRLLALAEAAPGGSAGPLHVTQAELATQVGTAREVVSRRLESWARRGLVETGRGTIAIVDPEALREISLDDM